MASRPPRWRWFFTGAGAFGLWYFASQASQPGQTLPLGWLLVGMLGAFLWTGASLGSVIWLAATFVWHRRHRNDLASAVSRDFGEEFVEVTDPTEGSDTYET